MNSPILLLAQKLDFNVLHGISRSTNVLGVKLAIFISAIGSPICFVLLTIGLCLFFWIHKKPYHLVQFLITTGVGLLTVYLVKIIIARPRPTEALMSLKDYSFPSGHATVATIFCAMIIFAYKNHIKNFFLRYVFIVFFIVVALAISFSRIYLSVHYLSDVVVGILLGLLISSISVFIFENFFKRETLI